MDITTTATSTPQEGPIYGVNFYNEYRRRQLKPRYYYSLSNSRSHQIINYKVVDAADNDSVASGITLGSLQAVTSKISKNKVYLRNIMEHLSLPADGSPTENNSRNKSGASSKTTRNFRKAQHIIGPAGTTYRSLAKTGGGLICIRT